MMMQMNLVAHRERGTDLMIRGAAGLAHRLGGAQEQAQKAATCAVSAPVRIMSGCCTRALGARTRRLAISDSKSSIFGDALPTAAALGGRYNRGIFSPSTCDKRHLLRLQSSAAAAGTRAPVPATFPDLMSSWIRSSLARTRRATAAGL